MGMPLEMNWMIVTKGEEEKVVNKENYFKLTKEGYRLYPLDIAVVEVRKAKEAATIGLAEIKEMNWGNGYTTITYVLKKLNGVN
ncbi:DUF2584 family protein [Priestia sp. SB1]|uniref:DUF2584 family protein n=1 Tax=Priestia aryabhattai TaxID=412384 RepID=A0AAX6NBK8_PRIAR|nr:DUF2584 family protein [Priestia aryabhattai]MDU9693303.1 DUF2584 family protein [Priestia aryabhattai]